MGEQIDGKLWGQLANISAKQNTNRLHTSKCNSMNSGVASCGALGHVPPSAFNNFIFSSLWSKSDSQLSKYCVVGEISYADVNNSQLFRSVLH